MFLVLPHCRSSLLLMGFAVQFWLFALRLGQSPSTAQLCDKMVGCFDHWHVEAIKARLPGGNGGYMWPQLVTAYLKVLGMAAIGQQLNVW